jgi:hypothetical protein
VINTPCTTTGIAGAPCDSNNHTGCKSC